MSHYPSSSSATRINGYAFWGMVIFGLVVLPSCGIPQLRCAKPAQPVPETFKGVASTECPPQLP